VSESGNKFVERDGISIRQGQKIRDCLYLPKTRTTRIATMEVYFLLP